MAQAANQHTPREWSLTDLLEYLTLAPFGYEIDAALREIERAISTGDLALIVDNYFDGKLQSYEIDPFRFHTGYALEFDYHSQRVLLVPRGRLMLGQKHGRVTKQNALRVWPPRPPASGDKAEGPQVSQVTPKAPKPAGKPGRKLSPEQAVRNAAIQNLLDDGVLPPTNMPWPKFRHEVRVRGGGFADNPKNEKYKRGFSDTVIRGFSDRQITRITLRLMKRQA